jgi:hypothetical protein
MKKYFSLALAIIPALLLSTGCKTNPSKAHVVTARGTYTKLALAQNPATGMYELGLMRGQAELTTIPIVFTNDAEGNLHAVVPDVVSRYEVSTHSAIFGNAALTSTLATGTNGVNTQVGGQTPPINTGVGTGSNLATPAGLYDPRTSAAAGAPTK